MLLLKKVSYLFLGGMEMFLALNEIRYAKLRYGLVIGVMFLIAYLVFFLTGLSYGLAQDNRTAVDKWGADTILLSKDANNSLSMSMLEKQVYDDVEAEQKAVLAQSPAVVMEKGNDDEKINVSFFGIDANQFLMPEVTSGRGFTADDEVVADESVKAEYGLKLGDEIRLSGNDKTFTIVGFTENAKFNVAPVLYTTINAYQEIRFEKQDTSENARINAIVVKGDLENYPQDTLDQVEISSFINDLPGYSAQVLTFGFMIGFLIVIAAIVIGIFIYVLTMQKKDIFGVMKAQGISSGFIARSVVAQTFILAFIGITLGLVGTYGTSLILPVAVPFQSNWLFLVGISLLMLVVAILGAVFSVRAVVKIDPLKAIG